MASPINAVGYYGPRASEFVNHFATVNQDMVFKPEGKKEWTLRKSTRVVVLDYQVAANGTTYKIWWEQADQTCLIRYKDIVPITVLPSLGRRWTTQNSQDHVAKIVRPKVIKTLDQHNNPIDYTADHRGCVSRVSDDGLYFVVNTVFGPDLGKKGVGIPVTFGAPLRTETSWSSDFWMHRRLLMREDKDCYDIHGKFVHTLKEGDVCIVRGVYPGTCVLRVTSESAESHRLFLRFDLANFVASRNLSYHTEDLMNHTCRALRDQKCKEDPTDVMSKGLIGTVLDVDLEKNWALVYGTDDHEYWVPFASFEVGVPVGPYRVISDAYNFDKPSAPFDPVSSGASGTLIDDLVSALLTGIHAESANLPFSACHLQSLYATPASRDRTVAAFTRGLSASTLRCVRQNQCFGDISDLKALQDASFLHRAGIYVRIYEGFSKTSKYHGRTFIYVGKTKDFAQRSITHKSDGKISQSQHYTIMRAARTVSYRVFWMSKNDDHKMLSLMESITTLILNSQSERTTRAPRVEASGKVTICGFDWIENASIASTLKRVADIVVQQYNFNYPPALEGLNIRSPIDHSVGGVSDPRRWVRQELEDRQTFMSGSAQWKAVCCMYVSTL
jgi:hypothetical protein